MTLATRFSIYWPFAATTMQRRFAYKFSFFSEVVGGLVQVFILGSLWNAIFQSSTEPTLNGFTQVGILTYVVMSWLTAQLTSSGVEWTVAFEIRRGHVAVNLVRPVSYFSRLLGEASGTILINFVSIVLPAWVLLQLWLVLFLGAPGPDPGNLGLYLVSVVLAFVLSFLMNFFFALAAFWVTYVWGFLMLKTAVVGIVTGELIPLAFFPAGWGTVLQYLPFAAMNATPVSLYLGRYHGVEAWTALGVQVFWVAVMIAVVRWAWKGAVEHLSVSGG